MFMRPLFLVKRKENIPERSSESEIKQADLVELFSLPRVITITTLITSPH